ncbi:hypothetical protein [Pedobacter roseus]|uniref:DUF8188 domain-containing protein n=1 Tax=Pedobacter roseus TaxID=336820 RepID=A0A7G9QBD2_9SPHI|nr:hypothetical protein [Pedobacter roseus]QNN40657.1 hypothetical protein H9L23_16120 [Pedobacter roseus]
MSKQAFGWLIGVLIVSPLIIFGISYLFKKKENNSKNAIPHYIEKCVEFKIRFPDKLEFRDTQYTISLMSPPQSIYKIFFKDVSVGKYLQITFFNYPEDKGLAFPSSLRGKETLMTINKDDLKNPTYGTKENPIPVFRVRENLPDSINKNRGAQDGWNVDITENQFIYNVEQYLTYIMPKEEFQRRFGKN